MKEILGLIALVAVLGFGGLLYRNALEHPGNNTNRAHTECTLEAKICPDGTAVGRTGLACEFAACAFPNVELAGVGIAYAVPPGFAMSSAGDPSSARIAAYTGTALTGTAGGEIYVYRYAIPEGESANEVTLASVVVYDAAQADSMLDFSPVIINGTKFETIDLSTDGRARTAYYLLRESDVVRFDAIDVRLDTASDTPMLPKEQLPAHRGLMETLLSSLQARN